MAIKWLLVDGFACEHTLTCYKHQTISTEMDHGISWMLLYANMYWWNIFQKGLLSLSLSLTHTHTHTHTHTLSLSLSLSLITTKPPNKCLICFSSAYIVYNNMVINVSRKINQRWHFVCLPERNHVSWSQRLPATKSFTGGQIMCTKLLLWSTSTRKLAHKQQQDTVQVGHS